MTTFVQRLEALHSHSPQQVAITLQVAAQPDLRITYAELLHGASAYASTFRRDQVKPGEVVILILQHGLDLVYSFWGAILHGAIPSIMPYLTEKLAPEQYRADLAALIAVTEPAAVVTYPQFELEVRGALKAGSSVRAVVRTDRLASSSELDFVNLGGSTRGPDDIVLLQHSSGTTGLQKGVALSHEAVFNQLDAYSQSLGLTDKDVIVSWLPLYHDMGLIAGFLMPILCGIPVVLSSPFDWVRGPHRLLWSVSEYRGTLSWLPNFAYNFCSQKIRERDLEGVDLSTWRGVINCSEPVRWASHEAFYERFKGHGLKREALQTSYAMAENVFAVTQSDLSRPPLVEDIDADAFLSQGVARPPEPGRQSLRMMSSGRPIENTEIRILNAHHRDLPAGHMGEIALRSNCMLTGYFNRPDATKEALRDGWYFTGDYGYVSAGEVFVTGRKKDMIIVGGKNVYPHDLESLSYEVPGVHAGRSVAFGIFNEETGTEDVAMVAEAETEDEAERERIADLIRQHVTKRSAVALRHVRVVGPHWILKTSSGKTARRANRDKFLKEWAEGQD
jgi:acyl-CoA synthetase (AMP-forming)/AMP-acid ligase II